MSQINWKVSDNRKLSANLHVVQLKNEKYVNKISLKGVAWLGKHFYIEGNVKILGGYKKKPYTTVICLGDQYTSFRESLLEDFQTLQNSNFQQTKEKYSTSDLPVYIDTISFGVKPYKGPNALSQSICSSRPGANLKIEGPFGSGIDLTRGFGGHCVLIGFGTGILPYLDLFDLLLKKSIYLTYKEKNLTQLLNNVKPNQDYSAIFPGARFTYYGAFKEIHDFAGYEFISELYKISKTQNLNLFDCLVRLKSSELSVPTTKSYFDKSFF